MSTRDLIDTLRAVPVAEALTRLGCRPAKRRGRMGPCPVCGGPEVLLGSVVWKCFRCDAKHDVAGTFRLLGDGWEGAQRLAEECGLFHDREPVGVPVVRWRDPSSAPPSYPPDAAALWARCSPVTRSEHVSRWLASRCVDPRAVERLDLARALPRDDLPAWAEAWAAGWWCILPARDASGAVVSLRARWVMQRPVRAKTRPPTGYSVAGTVLSRGPVAGDVLVVEGEPAYLHAATRVHGWHVVGVYAGCGGADVWRDVTMAHVATDADEPGDRYADAIAAWCPTSRIRPPDGMGWDDGLSAGGGWVAPWLADSGAHAAHWSWVDRALTDPEFRRQFEADIMAAGAAPAPPGTPSEERSDPTPATGSPP